MLYHGLSCEFSAFASSTGFCCSPCPCHLSFWCSGNPRRLPDWSYRMLMSQFWCRRRFWDSFEFRKLRIVQNPLNRGFHSYLSFRRGCSSRFGSGSGRPSSNQKTGFCFARNLLTGIWYWLCPHSWRPFSDVLKCHALEFLGFLILGLPNWCLFPSTSPWLPYSHNSSELSEQLVAVFGQVHWALERCPYRALHPIAFLA